MAARTAEERIALIDAKIAKKKEEIKVLEAQKQKLLHPVTMRSVMEKAKAAGLTAEQDVYKRQDGIQAHLIVINDGLIQSVNGLDQLFILLLHFVH